MMNDTLNVLTGQGIHKGDTGYIQDITSLPRENAPIQDQQTDSD